MPHSNSTWSKNWDRVCPVPQILESKNGNCKQRVYGPLSETGCGGCQTELKYIFLPLQFALKIVILSQIKILSFCSALGRMQCLCLSGSGRKIAWVGFTLFCSSWGRCNYIDIKGVEEIRPTTRILILEYFFQLTLYIFLCWLFPPDPMFCCKCL